MTKDDSTTHPLSYYVRRFAALSSAILLATDYYRDPLIFTSFSIWILIIHFLYFQLPLRSKALAYFHGVSFIASILSPCLYVYLLYFHPGLELEHMKSWNLPSYTIYLRTGAIYFAPALYHFMENVLYNQHIIASYRNKSITVIGAWTIAFLFTLSFIYELTFPDTEETESLQGISKEDYFRFQKLIFFSILVLAFALYYQFILREALRYQSMMTSRRSSGNLSEKTS